MANEDRPTSDPFGTTTDFSKVTPIGTLRAERSNHMHDQSPRDILIEVLGMIDSGELDPDTMVICYGLWDDHDEHTRKSGYRVAALDSLAVSGLLARISWRFNE